MAPKSSEADDVEAPTAPIPAGSSGVSHTKWSRFKARSRAIGKLCRARPHVIIVPMVLFAVVLVLGLWMVIGGARASADGQRREAQSQADAAAAALQLTIQRAIMPVEQVADWVKHTRNYSVIKDTWLERTSDWVNKTYNMTVTLGPQGWFEFAYPMSPSYDVLWDSLRVGGYTRPNVLLATQVGELTVSGPDIIRNSTSGAVLAWAFTFLQPIFIANVSESETFGIPYNVTDCPRGLCYNATTRTKWWGMAAINLPFTSFIDSCTSMSSLLTSYQWQLWRPANSTSTQMVAVDPTGQAKAQPDDAIRAVVPVANVEWELYIWKDHWEPNWEVPLIVTVVIVSIILAALLFAVLLSWSEHQMLLQSLLPQATIDRLRDEADWHDLAKSTRHMLDLVEIETPAQQMLACLRAFMEGKAPPMPLVLSVQRALQRSADVYRPPNHEFKARLEMTNMDEEARLGLARQLGESASFTWGRISDSMNLEPHDEDVAVSSVSTMDLTSALELLIRQPTGSSATPIPSQDSPSPRIASARESFTPAGPGPGHLDEGRATGATKDNSKENNKDIKESSSPRVGRGAPQVPGGEGGGRRAGEGQHRASEDPFLMLPCPPDLQRVGSTWNQQQQAQKPARPIMVEVDRILGTALTSWEFDSYALEEATQGHPLSVLAFYLMSTSGCIQFAGMNPTTLARFLRRIEAGYPSSNPYHNARHASNVLQTMHMILHQGGFVPHYADQHTVLSCYLAAIVHDFEHRGLSNDFVVNAGDKVALIYNDKSPMENHHLAASWAVVTQPQYNVLSGLSKEATTRVRKLVIELVLATDIKQHFTIMGQFQAQHSLEEQKASRGSDDPSKDPGRGLKSHVSINVLPEPPKPVNDSERMLCLQMALKCADMGHMSEPLPVHIRWLMDLEQEFFLQGDAEREKGLPISPMCDRTKEGVTKSQIGFFDFVCKPLFLHFSNRFKGTQPLLTGLLDNYAYWKRQAEDKSGPPSSLTK